MNEHIMRGFVSGMTKEAVNPVGMLEGARRMWRGGRSAAKELIPSIGESGKEIAPGLLRKGKAALKGAGRDFGALDAQTKRRMLGTAGVGALGTGYVGGKIF